MTYLPTAFRTSKLPGPRRAVACIRLLTRTGVLSILFSRVLFSGICIRQCTRLGKFHFGRVACGFALGRCVGHVRTGARRISLRRAVRADVDAVDADESEGCCGGGAPITQTLHVVVIFAPALAVGWAAARGLYD